MASAQCRVGRAAAGVKPHGDSDVGQTPNTRPVVPWTTRFVPEAMSSILTILPGEVAEWPKAAVC
jgi:hypothetical protein